MFKISNRNNFRKTARKEKNKKEGKEREIKVSSVLLRAVKHCLIFNGIVCLCQKSYTQFSHQEADPDVFLILNFVFFFYYCVGLLILFFSG